MVGESIPGCILQIYALLNGGTVSVSTVSSVCVSAMTTGFSSASISYTYDVDPQKRDERPDFYGYVPDGGARTAIFICMIVNSTLLLLVRAFSAAMLMIVKKRWFVIYWSVDMGMYLAYKVAREDFHYWVPIEGALGLFISLLVRVVNKTVTDFTGVLQFRGDAELGGLYWTANMFLALGSSFACVWVGRGGKLEFTLVGMATGLWILSFGIFMGLMKKKYRQGFWSTKTGREWAMDFFIKGEDDFAKQNIFGCNPKQWVAIREDVKKWVQKRWWTWDEEKPEWFDEAFVARVPLDMLPEEERQQRKSRMGRGSRGVGGGVRELRQTFARGKGGRSRGKGGRGRGAEGRDEFEEALKDARQLARRVQPVS